MKAYACYNKQEEIRKLSSSGGVFALLATAIIDAGGIVFAVCYDENFETEHREITSLENLIPSLGSKYIPSRLSDTFKKVQNYLINGKRILFVGTPCQCVGLKRFLGQEYDDLWLIDLVCHGVPSKIAWRKYLEEIDGMQLKAINMRDKTMGWTEWKYNWSLLYKDGSKKIIPQNQVSFMRGFVKDIYLRPSCYECCFKGANRVSDITIGDYWGVWNEQPEMDDNKGISLVIIHTDKGNVLLNCIRDCMQISKVSFDKVVRYNPSIMESAKVTEKRKLFFEKIKSAERFETIIKDLTEDSLEKKILGNFKRKFGFLDRIRR